VATVNNSVSLQNMLQSVLAPANMEQNQAYPPYIYQNQYRVLSSLLLSELSKRFPNASQEDIDCIMPFMEVEKIPVKDGYINLPDNYRNLLGNPSITLRPDNSDCSSPVVIDTANEFKAANLKGGCRTVPIEMLPQNEWDYRTTSTYAFPDYNNPIGCFFGKNRFKVCPYDISVVEVRYARIEKEYIYGYITQPDDTYIFNPLTSVETEWTSAAFKPFFNGLSSMYAAYTRDNTLSNWSQFLIQNGIL
jgi:hypothetical protein